RVDVPSTRQRIGSPQLDDGKSAEKCIDPANQPDCNNQLGPVQVGRNLAWSAKDAGTDGAANDDRDSEANAEDTEKVPAGSYRLNRLARHPLGHEQSP